MVIITHIDHKVNKIPHMGITIIIFKPTNLKNVISAKSKHSLHDKFVIQPSLRKVSSNLPWGRTKIPKTLNSNPFPLECPQNTPNLSKISRHKYESNHTYIGIC